ncbi:MAG: SulP family inorganic anion transporter [Bacteroidia bacterium]|nr:SulP family inorganic anion transporter [Bacteroidia bacterium]MDW8345933.1 SulP family inorganic anion transporter [Bacteroidia bacterium]
MKKIHFLRYLKDDFSASIVVFLVALPLCLGIAIASDAPPFSGLIAGIIGGIVVGLLSGSPLSVSGPAAGLAAIVSAEIQNIGSFEGFLVAVIIAGCLQILLGLLKLHVIAYFFPSAVIKGMLVSIGLLLIFKQLPHALGYDKEAFGLNEFENKATNENTFTAILSAVKYANIEAVIISIVSLLILILWDTPWLKKIKLIPGALIAVILSVMLNIYLDSFPFFRLGKEHLVSIPKVNSMRELQNAFILPDFSFLYDKKVWIASFTLCIIASLETLLSIEAIDKLDPHKRETPLSRELFAQGVGNTLSGLAGGLPITAVIVRSSANVNAGAKTKLSAVLHGLLLLVCVMFIPNLLNKIPQASLASILLYTGYKLAKPKIFFSTYQLGWSQFLPFVITIITVLLSDLLVGIAAGMFASGFFILRDNYKNFSKFNEVKQKDNYMVIRLSEQMTFLNKARLREVLQNIPEGTHVRIDASRCSFIDVDVLEVIYDFKEIAIQKGILLELVDVPKIKEI